MYYLKQYLLSSTFKSSTNLNCSLKMLYSAFPMITTLVLHFIWSTSYCQPTYSPFHKLFQGPSYHHSYSLPISFASKQSFILWPFPMLRILPGMLRVKLSLWDSLKLCYNNFSCMLLGIKVKVGVYCLHPCHWHALLTSQFPSLV